MENRGKRGKFVGPSALVEEENMEFGYKKLDVWHLAINLASVVFEINNKFPTSIQFTLGNQLLRSSISVSSNIAEGVSRSYKQETLRFLNIAWASLMECSSQIELGKINNLISADDFMKIMPIFDKTASKLLGLMKYYKSGSRGGSPE